MHHGRDEVVGEEGEVMGEIYASYCVLPSQLFCVT